MPLWPDEIPDARTHLPAGHAFRVPEVMFAKITEEDHAGWASRFAAIRGWVASRAAYSTVRAACYRRWSCRMPLWLEDVLAALALLPTGQAFEVPGLMCAKFIGEDCDRRDRRFAAIGGWVASRAANSTPRVACPRRWGCRMLAQIPVRCQQL